MTDHYITRGQLVLSCVVVLVASYVLDGIKANTLEGDRDGWYYGKTTTIPPEVCTVAEGYTRCEFRGGGVGEVVFPSKTTSTTVLPDWKTVCGEKLCHLEKINERTR